MSTKNTHTLVIVFNQFQFSGGLRYKEIIADAETCELVEARDLARKPRAARFDEVLENGSGDHDQWSAHRAVKLYKHPLLKS